MSQTPTLRILLVEDEPLIRMNISEELEDSGFVVVEASTADDAEVIMGDGSDIDAILTDIDMPGQLDGLGLAWLAHKRVPEITVIIMSGRRNPNPEEMPEGTIFHTKPYEINTVVADLRQQLSTKRAAAYLYR